MLEIGVVWHNSDMVWEVYEWFYDLVASLVPGLWAPHVQNCSIPYMFYLGPITTQLKDLMIFVVCRVTSGGELEHWCKTLVAKFLKIEFWA